MAIEMKLNISEDIWAEVETHIVDINKLQAGDFQKWVRKQVRTNGRKTEIATIQFTAVEMWLKELGIEAGFIAGGEVEIDGQRVISEWTNIGYYMFNDDGLMELTAGRWLEIASLEQPEYLLIAR